jgi:peptidoglycan/xylan/chitin deacetylase (PgdA/CDA1 family)
VLTATLLFTGYVGAETPDATWFGGGAVHGPATGNQVALTFDDGPNIGSTLKVMNILDNAGVKGTFFEVGKAIDADPQITRALYADGQLLGNHSYHHDQWRWLDPRYPELERTQQAFEHAIGTCPVLYRPPHGDRTPFIARVVHDHGMRMVLWSASAGDWATDDAALVARRIVEQAKPGAILLLHDGLDGKPTANREVLVRALPLILSGLRDKGLQPVRLDQLLGTAAYTSCR